MENLLKNESRTENKKKLIFLAGAVLLLSSIFAWTLSYSKSNADLNFIGTIEANELDVRNKIPGVISELLAEEGQEVEKGDILYTIDPKDVEVKQLQAQASLKAAEAQLTKGINGARSQDLKAAKSLADKAQAKVDLLEKKHQGYLALREAGGMAQDSLDEFETELLAAQLDALAADEQYKLALEGARSEDILALEAQVEGARAILKEVEIALDDTQVKAPISGSVSMIISKEGSLIGTGTPVLTITDYQDAWVEINADESLLGSLKVGQKASIKSKAYPSKDFAGEIVSINKNPDFAIKKSTNELNDQDVITYAIKIKITDQEKILYPGMMAEVAVHKMGE